MKKCQTFILQADLRNERARMRSYNCHWTCYGSLFLKSATCRKNTNDLCKMSLTDYPSEIAQIVESPASNGKVSSLIPNLDNIFAVIYKISAFSPWFSDGNYCWNKAVTEFILMEGLWFFFVIFQVCYMQNGIKYY